MKPGSSSTSASLLEKLRRSEDDEAWREFYRLYRGLVVGYARSRGCSPTQCREVMQETTIELIRALPGFEYDRARGRFRAYLFAIVRTSIAQVMRREWRYVHVDSQGTTPDGESPFATIRDEQAEAAGTAWDRRWDQAVLAQAFERVREKVSETTFRSFTRYVLEDRPVGEVCRELRVSSNAVYQHRNRVISLLRREVAAIRAELGEADA